jgi:hypothetical protein
VKNDIQTKNPSGTAFENIFSNKNFLTNKNLYQ